MEANGWTSLPRKDAVDEAVRAGGEEGLPDEGQVEEAVAAVQDDLRGVEDLVVDRRVLGDRPVDLLRGEADDPVPLPQIAVA